MRKICSCWMVLVFLFQFVSAHTPFRLLVLLTAENRSANSCVMRTHIRGNTRNIRSVGLATHNTFRTHRRNAHFITRAFQNINQTTCLSCTFHLLFENTNIRCSSSFDSSFTTHDCCRVCERFICRSTTSQHRNQVLRNRIFPNVQSTSFTSPGCSCLFENLVPSHILHFLLSDSYLGEAIRRNRTCCGAESTVRNRANMGPEWANIGQQEQA